MPRSSTGHCFPPTLQKVNFFFNSLVADQETDSGTEVSDLFMVTGGAKPGFRPSLSNSKVHVIPDYLVIYGALQKDNHIEKEVWAWKLTPVSL